jgi:hypothetical protein
VLKGCEGAMVHGCVVLDRGLVHTSCIGSGSGWEGVGIGIGWLCLLHFLSYFVPRTHRSEQSRGFFI